MAERDGKVLFSRRLNQALDNAGVPPKNFGRQTTVAKMFGVTQKAARKWLEGEGMPATKRIGEIAERLGVYGEWLLSGQGPMNAEVSNVEPVHDVIRRVPLISWIQAGYGVDAVDQLKPGEYEDLLPCPVNCSEQTFALRVRGESMEPEYHEGDIVFVDPMVEPTHRKDVVVRNHVSDEAMLKRLFIEGDRKYLRALNPLYQEPVRLLKEDDRICGIVVFSGRYR